MAQNPIKTLLCWLGRHTRSRSYMAEHHEYYESVCRYCRMPMVKTDGKWKARKPG